MMLLGLLAATSTAAASPSPSPVLDLEAAVRTAQKNQPSIRQAQAAHEVARARVDQAASGLWPQIRVSASYDRFAKPTTRAATAGTAMTTPSYDSFVLNGTLAQLLFDFGQTTGRWHSAEATALAQEAAVRASRLAVTLDVRTAYFRARAARELVRVDREALDNEERHVAQITGFVTVGTRPEIDLAQARTDRANAELQWINADNDSLKARADLARAIGLDGPLAQELADDAFPAVEDEDAKLEALVDTAVAHRPEIANLIEAERAQALAIDAAKGARWPVLSAGAQAIAQGPSPDALQPNASIGVSIDWNVFEGFRTEAGIHEARASLDQLNAQLDTLRLSVRVEVEEAQLAVRGAKAAQRAAAQVVENARERLRLAEARYETGVGSAIERGDAQLAYTRAASQQVTTTYDLATSRAQLARALGEDFDSGLR